MRSIARRFRPQMLSEVVAQELVVKALSNMIERNTVAQAFLLLGIRGVGKTTLARILAKSVNCEQGMSVTPCNQCSNCKEIASATSTDCIELDAATRTGVDDTRALLAEAMYAPVKCRYKVFIIDEAHMLSVSSFNALLKTLEEPPEHLIFILVTTNAEKIPKTIHSRCIEFSLRPASVTSIISVLEKVCTQEKIKYEPVALESIAVAAQGSVRDSLTLLEQAIAYCNEQLGTVEVKQMLGSVQEAVVDEVLTSILQNDKVTLAALLEQLRQSNLDYLKTFDEMIRQIHRSELLRITQKPAEYKFAQLASYEDLQLIYQVALQSRKELLLLPWPELGFEMAMFRMMTLVPFNEQTLAINKANSVKPVGKKTLIEKQPVTKQPASQPPVKKLSTNTDLGNAVASSPKENFDTHNSNITPNSSAKPLATQNQTPAQQPPVQQPPVQQDTGTKKVAAAQESATDIATESDTSPVLDTVQKLTKSQAGVQANPHQQQAKDQNTAIAQLALSDLIQDTKSIFADICSQLTYSADTTSNKVSVFIPEKLPVPENHKEKIIESLTSYFGKKISVEFVQTDTQQLSASKSSQQQIEKQQLQQEYKNSSLVKRIGNLFDSEVDVTLERQDVS